MKLGGVLDLSIAACSAVLTVALLAFTAVAVSSDGRDQRPGVPTPFRMGDWATCRDGTNIYSRNPQYPLEPPAEEPCAKNGGVRAFGPGKRLNER